MMMHAWGMHEWGTMAWPLVTLWIGFKLVFWVLLLTAMVLGVRWLRRATAPHAESALDVLRVRYARGELSKQEFDSMRRDLE